MNMNMKKLVNTLGKICEFVWEVAIYYTFIVSAVWAVALGWVCRNMGAIALAGALGFVVIPRVLKRWKSKSSE